MVNFFSHVGVPPEMGSLKIVPPAPLVTPPAVVIPYKVEPLSVKLPRGRRPVVPEEAQEYRFVYDVPVVLTLKIIPFEKLPPLHVMPYNVLPSALRVTSP